MIEALLTTLDLPVKSWYLSSSFFLMMLSNWITVSTTISLMWSFYLTSHDPEHIVTMIPRMNVLSPSSAIKIWLAALQKSLLFSILFFPSIVSTTGVGKYFFASSLNYSFLFRCCSKSLIPSTSLTKFWNG